MLIMHHLVDYQVENYNTYKVLLLSMVIKLTYNFILIRKYTTDKTLIINIVLTYSYWVIKINYRL